VDFSKILQSAKTEKEKFDLLHKMVFGEKIIKCANEFLKHSAKMFGAKEALICKDESISYQGLYDKSLAFTKKLIDSGVQKGDRVIVCIENSIEFYIAYFGAWQTGAVITPVNTLLHERELVYIFQDCSPKAIVVSESFVDIFEPEAKKYQVLFFTTANITNLQSAPVDLEPRCLPMDEMTALLYTSGTTGFPKGVMLSSRNILTNVVQAVSKLDMTANDQKIFAVLPLFHSFAQNTCVWSALLCGVTVIIVPKLDRSSILYHLKYKPTIFLGVPALYGLICLMRTAPLNSVKLFVSGGDILPDKIRQFFGMVYGRKICNGYGLTEASPVVAAELDDQIFPSGVIGRALPGIECQIRDIDSGKLLDQCGRGLLWVKGDNIMLGYYNDKEATEKVLQDGWLNTGDCAEIDKSGRITICGREKDLIIYRGLNIYPPEIENVLLSYPNVFSAAILGKKHVDHGEVPIAFIVLRDKENEIETKLRKVCQENLASYKIPRQFIVVKALPMTATGKIDKKKMRIEFEKELES